jgi:hypothetical protein
MDGSPEKRQDLAMRLKNAGCNVSQTGADWLSAGDFTACIRSIDEEGSPKDESDLRATLEALSGTEIYWLTKAVLIDKAQTLTGCGWADPTAATLISKPLLAPIDVPNRPARMSIPHSIPNDVWQYLSGNKRWLLEQAEAKNEGHAARLEQLSQVQLPDS